MILGYILTPHDDDSYFLGEETFSPQDPRGFHDWRFGTPGKPHSATCATCGTKTKPRFINPTFRVRHRRRDIVATVDGYDLVSSRLRDFCQRQGWKGLKFLPLPADPEFFVFRPTKVARFDPQRGGTRQEKRCPKCRKYYDVVGGDPAGLAARSAAYPEGFQRTDLEFGSGPEQGPLLVVGPRTAELLREQKFQKFALEAIEQES